MIDKTASPRTYLRFGRHTIHALLATTALSGMLTLPAMAQDPSLLWSANTHGAGAQANGTQQCVWNLGQSIPPGATALGFIHTADANDVNPVYPQSIYDNAGNSYNMSPGVTWSPFPEPIGVWYLTNVQGSPHQITLDYTQYPNDGKTTINFCDAAVFVYSNVTGLAIVNPVLEDGPSASLTISTPNPSLIWAFAAIYTNINTTLIATPGFSVLDDNFGDNIEVSGSNGLVPAGDVTLTWNFPGDFASFCAATAGASDCPGLFMAAALYGDSSSASPSATDPAAQSASASPAATDPSSPPASSPPPAPPQRGHHHRG